MSAQVGVKNLHIAVMKTEDTRAAQAVYGPNISVAETISLNLQPQTSNNVLYADDGASETDSANGVVNVDLNTKDLPLEIRAIISGSEYNSETGGLIHKASDTPPYIAMSFESIRADGTTRYVQFYKGKATQPKENYQTKKDNTTFNTPTTSLQFIRRIYDDKDYGMWDEPEFKGGSTFFNSVHEDGGTVAMTVETTPIDNATGVAIDSTIAWTFSTELNQYTVNKTNFIVVDESGATVTGALVLNDSGKVVTFTADSDLASGVGYTAIATTNVKDLNGSALAVNNVINFTTA